MAMWLRCEFVAQQYAHRHCITAPRHAFLNPAIGVSAGISQFLRRSYSSVMSCRVAFLGSCIALAHALHKTMSMCRRVTLRLTIGFIIGIGDRVDNRQRSLRSF